MTTASEHARRFELNGTPREISVAEKFLPRTHDDYATVSVAAAVRLDADGRCTDVHVAGNGVHP
jgi:CO/xanthine dehydrogenase FAD-binding subunit